MLLRAEFSYVRVGSYIVTEVRAPRNRFNLFTTSPFVNTKSRSEVEGKPT